jgi:hypothetical protein
VPLAVLLTTAGLQAPVTPFKEVVGNTGAELPSQMEALAPNGKVGVIIGFTVTVNVTGSAQGSDVGVNVYVPLAVLLTTAGLQVPVIPFDEVTDNAGTASPSQIVVPAPKENEGVMTGFTVTVRVTDGAQGLEVLLNV